MYTIKKLQWENVNGIYKAITHNSVYTISEDAPNSVYRVYVNFNDGGYRHIGFRDKLKDCKYDAQLHFNHQALQFLNPISKTLIP